MPELPESKNRRPIAALLVGNCVSLVGSSLTAVAIPWFVLTTTGSAGKAGLTGAAEYLPAFAAGILGGPAVDRIGPRRATLLADLVSGTGIILIPLLYHTVGLAFWQLLLLVLLGASLTIPGVSARRSMLPELANLGQIRLDRVNAILESNNQIAMLLGPPLAGLLIGFLGASNVLWLDAGSYFFSIMIVLFFVPDLWKHRARSLSQGYASDIRAGLHWLWNDSVVRAIAMCLLFTNAIGAPFFSLIIAVYAKDRWNDPKYLGLLLSASSVGLLTGTALFGAFNRRVRRRVYMVIFMLTLSVPYWPFAAQPPFIAMLGAMALGGLFDGPVNPLLVTVRLERIPEELRGRVFAATSAIAQLMPALTIPLTGLLIQRIGLSATVITLASFTLLIGAVFAIRPVWAEMDNRPSVAKSD